MKRPDRQTLGSYAALALALVLALMLHGAVPGFALPTLGQAIWSSGFALSFNESFPPALVATHFGAPMPAAIAFGLAGAYPMAWFIAAGLHPADAYSAMAAMWFSIAFLSAWRIALRLGLGAYLSSLAAFVWISMPVIWAHSGYSMLSIGIALLPFYFLGVFRLIAPFSASVSERIGTAAFYLAACIISVFMDGYSFMMFAVGSSIFLLGAFVAQPANRRYLLVYVAPVQAMSFAIAFLAYVAYIGKSQFNVPPITFFRAWGADITFFLQPTEGIHWIWDLLGLSEARPPERFFGDASVWMTTFILPLAVAGIVAWCITRSRSWLVTAALAVALLSLYLSLGPSLKFNSMRPIEALSQDPVMPGKFALGATGNAWLSKYVPGFKNMRTPYRWVALACFGFWMLSIFLLVRMEQDRRLVAAALLAGLLIVSNLPHPLVHWRETTDNRDDFLAIDQALVADMRKVLKPDEMVAFLPFRNDFFVNYLAPAVGFRSYNIGGDKNLADAQLNWPPVMGQFPSGVVDELFVNRVVLLLARGEADAVVLPYLDLLVAAHDWPSPPQFQDDIAPVLDQLRSTGFVTIEQRENYAVARLAPEIASEGDQAARVNRIGEELCLPPKCIGVNGLSENSLRRVGKVEGAELLTTGKGGYIHFGPYAPAEAGTYRLTLSGNVLAAGGGWVDVTSSASSIQHARFNLPEHNKSGNVILDETVKLNNAVTDLEIRIWVSDRSDLKLTAYHLEKID